MINYITLRIIFIITGSVIALENTLTIILIASVPKLRTKTNIIILSLAIVDLLTGVSFALMLDMPQLLVMIKPSALQYYCVIMYSQLIFVTGASIAHLVLLTLDRYIAIIHPLRYHVYFTTARMAGCLVICWIMPAVMASIFGLLIYNSSLPIHNCSTKELPPLLNYMNILGLLGSILLLVTAYVKIFLEINKQNRRIMPMVPGSRTMNSMSKKSVLTILITVGGFVICWLPNVIYVIVSICDPKMMIESNASLYVEHILSYIALINSGFNPIIYVLRMTEFRAAFLKVFCCFFNTPN